MAHVGTSRVDDEVGEVLEPANRLRSHRRPEVEDEAGDDVAGLPWSHASVCSSTASWWSSSPCWLGGWWPMATATATACSRGSQGREGKREPEEGERSRGSGENEGRLWVSPWRREDVGEAATAKQEVEARARARRHASASRQRLKTAVPLVGWAAKWTGRVGWASTGEAQVSDR